MTLRNICVHFSTKASEVLGSADICCGDLQLQPQNNVKKLRTQYAINYTFI